MRPDGGSETQLPLHGHRPSLARLGLVALVHGLLVWAGMRVSVSVDGFTPLWPATGVAVGAVLLGGPWYLLPVFLSGFAVNATGAVWAGALLGAAGNTLHAWAGAWLYRRFTGHRGAPRDARDVLVLAFLVAMAASTISASIGAIALRLFGQYEVVTGGSSLWMTWWVSDALGTLTVLPVLLAWLGPREGAPPPARQGRAAAILVAIVALTSLLVLLALRDGSPWSFGAVLLSFPVLTGAALRFGMRGGAATATGFALAAVAGTVLAEPALGLPGFERGLVATQVFVAVITLTGLLLAAEVERRARAELGVSEGAALLRRVTDAVPGIVYSYELRPDGTDGFPLVSRRARDLLGLPPGPDLIDTRDVWSRVPAEELPAMQASILASARDLTTWMHEFRIRDAQGQLRWLRGRSEPEGRRPDGAVVWHGILLDITDEKGDEAFAVAQREVLERIAGGAPTLEVLHSLCRLVEGRISGALASVLLLDLDTRTIRGGVGPSLDTAYLRAFEGMALSADEGSCGAAMHHGRPVVSPDLRADPNWRTFLPLSEAHGLRSCWSVPIRGAEGRVLGSFVVYRREPGEPTADAMGLLGTLAHLAGIALERAESERALAVAEEQLRQAQKMEAVGQLAGGIAHDFNNILTVIRAAAEFLAEQVPAGSTGREDVELIRGAALRAESLTRQLLAFSRRQMWQPRAVFVNAVVERVEGMLRRTIGEHVELRTVLAPDLPAVWVDESQLEQVLVNLAVNARDAMPRGGRFELETAAVTVHEEGGEGSGLAPGRYVRIVARDSGVGMDPATMRRAFEPFFTTKEPGKGTGLGLSMVYGIVQRANGRITVESAPGAGATFRIYLPVSDAPVEAEPSRGDGPAAGGRGEVVLLAEDEPMVRALAARLLRERGYEVLEAEHGEAALAALAAREGRVGLLLSDVVMPGMSGRELAQAVRARWPGVPVLFMSGYTDDVALLREVVAEGSSVLQKPFAPAELAARVREALNWRGRRDRTGA